MGDKHLLQCHEFASQHCFSPCLFVWAQQDKTTVKKTSKTKEYGFGGRWEKLQEKLQIY